MRAGALSDPSVAALLEEGFVCAWEKKGAVETYRVKGDPKQSIKLGGNILTYVCTPQGEVIHAIPGAWGADNYREQLAWARGIDPELTDLEYEKATTQLRTAHRERLQTRGRWRFNHAHELLSKQAHLPISELEKPFFEALLGQTYAPEKDIIIRELNRSDFRALMGSMVG